MMVWKLLKGMVALKKYFPLPFENLELSAFDAILAESLTSL